MPSSFSRCSALVAAAGAGDEDIMGLLGDEVARKRQVPITPNARRRIHWTMVLGDTPQFGGQGLARTDAEPRAALLLQRRRNFLETRLGAAFVDQAARCAADADAADHLVTGLDQHGAGKQQDSRYAGQRGSGGGGGELRYQFALQILLPEPPPRGNGERPSTAPRLHHR